MAFDYRTTIHTMEIKATSELGYPDFMTRCNALEYVSEVQCCGDGLYTLRLNPLTILSLNEHKSTLEHIQADLRVDTLTVIRIDLCCDLQIDYVPTEKLCRFFVLILANQIEAHNRYLIIDPLTLETKTIRAVAKKNDNGELQVEHCNRALTDQSSRDDTALNRLAFRINGTQACENYSIEEMAERWIKRLQAVIEPVEMTTRMQAVERALNHALIEQWRQLSAQMDKATGKSFNDFVFFNLSSIFTRRQMTDLFILYGDTEQQAENRAKNIRRDRRKAFRDQLFTRRQLTEEANNLFLSIRQFMDK